MISRRAQARLLTLGLCLLGLAHAALAFTPRRRDADGNLLPSLRPSPGAGLRAHSAGLEGIPTPETDCHSDHSSTVWMCISTVLVLGMSPALALFEAGMLRSKSTVSLITQIFAGVITLSVMWVCFGYSLTFGPSQAGLIGNFDHAFYINISYEACSPHAQHIPEALFATFQQMFAVITPLLMTGAFAERLKFKSYMLFIVLWQIIIYYPLAHWIWGGGFLGKWGVLDFAGGIVIHTSAGAGSLVSAIYLGRRQHFFDFMGEFPPSNLPLAATGAALLWIGWFGFNGGSALASGPVAVSAIVSTQVGCSCGAFTWLVLSWWKEKPQAAALINGALAGLAGITPASGYINTPASILMGVIFGAASFFGVIGMKHHLNIDDALDVSSIHGLTGALGALAIGLFAQKSIDPDGADGAFYGNPMQLAYQTVGVVFTAFYAGILSWVLLRFIDWLHGGIRALENEEEVGLDWSEHHEIAYHKLHVLDDTTMADEPHYGLGHSHSAANIGNIHNAALNASSLMHSSSAMNASLMTHSHMDSSSLQDLAVGTPLQHSASAMPPMADRIERSSSGTETPGSRRGRKSSMPSLPHSSQYRKHDHGADH